MTPPCVSWREGHWPVGIDPPGAEIPTRNGTKTAEGMILRGACEGMGVAASPPRSGSSQQVRGSPGANMVVSDSVDAFVAKRLVAAIARMAVLRLGEVVNLAGPGLPQTERLDDGEALILDG